MKQNIYDNETFFQSYMKLRETTSGLNEVLEIPAFRSLLPQNFSPLTVLDLGCGFGSASQWYITRGAEHVVGIDISKNMIAKAKKLHPDTRIEYRCLPIEDIDFPPETFDIVVSSLAFHYIRDFDKVIRTLHHCLKPSGFLIFSQEHPIMTANINSNGWEKDEEGNKLHWRFDDYGEEGIRKQTWFVDGVVKYHRTLATILNTLTDTGFSIHSLLEPAASKEAENLRPSLAEERRRPPFLMVKAQKNTPAAP